MEKKNLGLKIDIKDDYQNKNFINVNFILFIDNESKIPIIKLNEKVNIEGLSSQEAIETIRERINFINESRLKVYKNLSKSINVFTPQKSREHKILTGTDLSSQIKLTGISPNIYSKKERSHNTYRENNSSVIKNKISVKNKESNSKIKNVIIDFRYVKERLFKSESLGITGYNSFSDFYEKVNPVFRSDTIYYNPQKNINGITVEFLKPHIILARKDGRKPILMVNPMDISIVSDINRRLVNYGIETVDFIVKQKFSEEVHINKAIEQMKNHVTKIVDNIFKKEDDKVVMFTDGSRMNKFISGGFLFEFNNEEFAGSKTRMEDKSKIFDSNGSEILALNAGIKKLIKEDINGKCKKLELITDSDFLYHKLNNENGYIDPKINGALLLKEIIDLLKKNKIQIKVSVIKSHQEDNLENPSFQRIIDGNNKVDKIAYNAAYSANEHQKRLCIDKQNKLRHNINASLN
jgi:hypothetical protein